jgi:acyl-coenzyme A synthetase/AMP-(fatty) acid ligase
VPEAKVSNLSTAIVVKRQSYEDLAEHDILSVVAEKLPPTKQLYGGAFFIQEMPLNPNGKILRRLVREIAITKYKNRMNV